MHLFRLLFGRRLASDEHPEHRLGVASGVPAIGLDGLASSVYGPEAALFVLAPLGAAGGARLPWLFAGVLLLLGLLFRTYRRTIRTWPDGRGTYRVTHDTLGARAGLLAAAALMVDYVLNVAVGIAAGVGQLVSSAPALQPWRTTLCLGILALVTVVNLRGTLSSGLAFALPAWGFVAGMAVVLGLGLLRAGDVAPPVAVAATAPASAWLMVRAFAVACTSLTGVEAVVDGVGAFRDPPERRAGRTLALLVLVMGSLLAGVALLARAHGVTALDETASGYRSVLAQLVEAVVGRGVAYHLMMLAALSVLCLSANTSFVDFPRLCRAVAADGYLPRAFARTGRRLVHTLGIVVLSGVAAALLVAFEGVADRLVPLFAVGAFAAFTLSQLALVAHERRATPGVVTGVLGLVGATTTGAALVVLAVTSFAEGAWVAVLALPGLVAGFRAVKRHHDRLDADLQHTGPVTLPDQGPPLVVVPLTRWDGAARKAVRTAVELSTDVVVLMMSGLHEAGPGAFTAECWRRDVLEPARRTGRPPPRLVPVPTPYRRLLGPVTLWLEREQRLSPEREVLVVLPEIAVERWWHLLLHDRRSARLRRALLRFGGRHLSVLTVPWHLDRLVTEPRPEP